MIQTQTRPSKALRWQRRHLCPANKYDTSHYTVNLVREKGARRLDIVQDEACKDEMLSCQISWLNWWTVRFRKEIS